MSNTRQFNLAVNSNLEVTRHMKAKIVTAIAAGALLAPAVTQAHVSVHPNTIPAGAFVELHVRVPSEEQGAYVSKVDVLLPRGFVSADYAGVPGWSVRVTNSKLATPVQSDDGPIDTELSRITWTWTGPTDRVEEGQFVDFPLAVAIPADDTGRSLAFKTVQTYSNGTVAHWIGAPSAEQPAPTINVTAKGGVIEDVAGGEAGPPPGATPTGQAAGSSATPAAKSSARASRSLGIAALILGALGLLAGAGGLIAARRSRPGV
ncbi:MAG TPA: YcnI family protein [Solirubrobacteraceae bacterium]|nr:YcnI family protein [Solirubrobacteraceae bacterium]